MGGMIAQRLVLDHPDRVRSLTSIMSTTGASDVGMPSPEAQAVLLRPPATDRESAIAGSVVAFRVTASTGFEVTDESLRSGPRQATTVATTRRAVPGNWPRSSRHPTVPKVLPR